MIMAKARVPLIKMVWIRARGTRMAADCTSSGGRTAILFGGAGALVLGHPRVYGKDGWHIGKLLEDISVEVNVCFGRSEDDSLECLCSYFSLFLA